MFKQIGDTCWLYSYFHIIEYSDFIKTFMKITEEYAKDTPQMVCGQFNIYKEIHSLIRKHKVTENTLRTFLNSQYSNILGSNTIGSGANDRQWALGFRRLLNTYRITPNFVDIVSPEENVDKRRWAIQGCGISIDFGKGNTHAVAGVIVNRKHVIIDSDRDISFLVNWETDKNWDKKLIALYSKYTRQWVEYLTNLRNKTQSENRKKLITLQIEEDLRFFPKSVRKIANIYSVRLK